MKLAEALSNRADLQRRISQLKGRLKDSAKVQEGDTPAEDVETLFLELDSCLEKQEKLVYQINCANMQIMHNGENLTRMLARRDSLSARVSLMREVLKHVTETETRYGRNEIRYIRTVDVANLRKDTDSYCKQLRELDNLIQSINWTVELL
ncbi:DIP1984 family protein [Phocaeicola vulgatus]|jgi:hypothetical protein|uniref:Septicolysin n=1 Tax=Phocaeicola vulgatus TaxID=821 RepID=A0A412QY02_PHOVU|nr:DIP1984 family protein [Phocaeicola vulgatus]MCG0152659.1 DIP1984 family protein [Phocaeicola vulgatus]MCG0326821.1 DIP1984 family protein [Phocaeicola vulgatus]MCG0330479.1 DIP1984 family protein [Phocaeicola vulgatus]RGT96084.1 hypothetical protein DWX04_05015 [Phocaeicola vulgatus]